MKKMPGLYILLFLAQTLGEIVIFTVTIPVYRRLVDGEVYQDGPPPELVVPVLVGVALIQIGYWTRRRCVPEFQFGKHVLLGHVALFLGRLNFIIANGLFALTFFLRFDVVNLTLANLLLFFIVIFSVFCYTRELERLGQAWGA